MHYHPGLRNHEHFSFGNQKNAVKPLRGFNYPDGEKGIIIRRESWCLYRRVKWTHNIEVHCAPIKTFRDPNWVVTIKEQAPRSFSGGPEKNMNDYKSITLRSDRELESLVGRRSETRVKNIDKK